MKKILLSSIVILIVLAISLSLFACKDPKNEESGKVNYTVSVNCEESLILDTVSVALTDAEGNQVTQKVSLDANRKATFSLKAGVYKVVVEGSLSAYNDIPETLLTPTALTANITLTKKGSGNQDNQKAIYKVTLTMPNGDVVAGKTIQLCTLASQGGACVTAKTDENGVATFELKPDTYEIHIWESEIPEGFAFDDSEYTVTSEVKEITIQFKVAE